MKTTKTKVKKEVDYLIPFIPEKQFIIKTKLIIIKS
jgi:hypothetical protein